MKISVRFLLLLLSIVIIVCQGRFNVIASSEVAESYDNGRSLVIIFDTTWSMDDDLQELRAGAAHIVKEMLKKEKNPIYSYIFVPFNDPCECCD